MIGHNNGPPFDAPTEESDYVRAQTWRRAYKQAHQPPSAEVALLRLRAAEALGLEYRDYSAILKDRGRSPRALFFGLGGTLVRTRNNEIAEDRHGAVTLMPGVRAKLTKLHDCLVFVVTNQARIAEGLLARETVEGYIRQVSDLCGGAISDFAIAGEAPGPNNAARKPVTRLIRELIGKHALQPGQGVMVSGTAEDENCASEAGLARFLWSWRYFALPLPASP